MSDVEKICFRNWEQRRHAEEYEAENCKKWDWESEAYEQFIGEELPDPDEIKKKKKRRKIIRAARDAGRVFIGMSVVSALIGLELLWPLFLLIAILFYAARFELDPESEGIWTRIIV